MPRLKPMPTRIETDLRSVKPHIANARRLALELLASPHLSRADRELAANLTGEVSAADILLGDITRRQEELQEAHDANGQKHR